MAASGIVAPGPSDWAAASTKFQLEVNTLGGGCLAAIPEAQGSWQLGDVLGKLPELLPGHKYQLLKGEAVLAPGTAIAEWAQPFDGKACITAVVVPRTEKEQQELDVALIDAAGALDVEKVRELLHVGANAKSRSGSWTRMTALHKAVDTSGPRERGNSKDAERDKVEEEEEEEGRLQAVLGALLSARADVDAQRQQSGALFAESNITYALHCAVQRGSLGAVRMLVEARASVDVVAYQSMRRVFLPDGYMDERDCEYTALHAATQAGNLPVTAILLEQGANVNAVRHYWEHYGPVKVSETALHMAVAGGHQALVALLVQARADAGIARSRDGKDTSLEELCAGNPTMLKVLRTDSSAAFLAGGHFGAEVEAALATFAVQCAVAS